MTTTPENIVMTDDELKAIECTAYFKNGTIHKVSLFDSHQFLEDNRDKIQPIHRKARRPQYHD